jgi:hypothetical protein
MNLVIILFNIHMINTFIFVIVGSVTFFYLKKIVCFNYSKVNLEIQARAQNLTKVLDLKL